MMHQNIPFMFGNGAEQLAWMPLVHPSGSKLCKKNVRHLLPII